MLDGFFLSVLACCFAAHVVAYRFSGSQVFLWLIGSAIISNSQAVITCYHAQAGFIAEATVCLTVEESLTGPGVTACNLNTQWVVEEATDTEPVVCRALTICDAGTEIEETVPSKYQDRVCRSRTPCDSNLCVNEALCQVDTEAATNGNDKGYVSSL